LDIRSENTPKYQWIFKGYEDKVAIYGRLYTWFAVSDSRNIAPSGWHVPTDAEWATLINYLGGQNVAGAKLKEIGTTNWNSPNTDATNESGFTALSSGYRAENGYFYNYFGIRGYWWSATQCTGCANISGLDWILDVSSLIGDEADNASLGLSVRCVMD